MTLLHCPICGDDAEPADCPDRHGWEDHCLTCVGECNACHGRMCDCPTDAEIDAAIAANYRPAKPEGDSA